jgi:hypothetical protein
MLRSVFCPCRVHRSTSQHLSTLSQGLPLLLSWSLVMPHELTSVPFVGRRTAAWTPVCVDPHMSSYLVELRADRSTVGRKAARPSSTTVGTPHGIAVLYLCRHRLEPNDPTFCQPPDTAGLTVEGAGFTDRHQVAHSSPHWCDINNVDKPDRCIDNLSTTTAMAFSVCV